MKEVITLNNLNELIEKYPQFLSSKEKLKSFLSDQYPTEKRNINILCIMYECEMFDDIIIKKNFSAADELRLLTQLENDYGISPDYSTPCVKICENTFNNDFKNKYNCIADFLNKNIKPAEVKPTIAIVEGNPADYEVKVSNGEARIIKFIGEPTNMIVVPNVINGVKITSIGSEAFTNQTQIEKIIISEGIREISNGAFSNCYSLKEVRLPSTLEDLGSNPKRADFENSINAVYGVFEQTDIVKINLPDNLIYIGARAFNRCCNLTEITIPKDITEIEKGTFSGCTSLRNVKLPEKLTKIEPFAFDDCPSLTEITLPENVDYIGKSAFNRCSKLYKVNLNPKLRVIEANVFQACNSLREITLPDSIQFIHDRAFDNVWIRSDPSSLTVYCGEHSYSQNFAEAKGFNVEFFYM